MELRDLKSQRTPEKWYWMTGLESNRATQSRFLLSIRWVYAQSLDFENLAYEVECELKREKRELASYEGELSIIRKLAQSAPKEDQNKIRIGEMNHGINEKSKLVGSQRQKMAQETIPKQSPELFGWNSASEVPYSSLPKKRMRALFICFCVWLFLSLVSVLNRPVFLDVSFHFSDISLLSQGGSWDLQWGTYCSDKTGLILKQGGPSSGFSSFGWLGSFFSIWHLWFWAKL